MEDRTRTDGGEADQWHSWLAETLVQPPQVGPLTSMLAIRKCKHSKMPRVDPQTRGLLCFAQSVQSIATPLKPRRPVFEPLHDEVHELLRVGLLNLSWIRCTQFLSSLFMNNHSLLAQWECMSNDTREGEEYDER